MGLLGGAAAGAAIAGAIGNSHEHGSSDAHGSRTRGTEGGGTGTARTRTRSTEGEGTGTAKTGASTTAGGAAGAARKLAPAAQ
jgi:hypothetical protein